MSAKTRAETPAIILVAMDKLEQEGKPPFVPVGFAMVTPETLLDTGKVATCLVRRGGFDGDFINTLFESLKQGFTVYLAFAYHPDGAEFKSTMTQALEAARRESDSSTVH